MVGFHRGDFVFNFDDRLGQLLKCAMKPISVHLFI